MAATSKIVHSKQFKKTNIARDELIARAERAIDNMREEFGTWMEDEITSLAAVMAEWQADFNDQEASAELYRRAHDLKGQAATLGFPIVGRIAASLCELLSLSSMDPQSRITLAKSHVGAINAAVRDEIRDDTNETAKALATELEAAVARFF
ncbi:MAG: Hpt domain-containing protein [Parvibaculum sp.]